LISSYMKMVSGVAMGAGTSAILIIFLSTKIFVGRVTEEVVF